MLQVYVNASLMSVHNDATISSQYTYLSFLEVVVHGELQFAQFDLRLGALGILVVFHVYFKLFQVRLNL